MQNLEFIKKEVKEIVKKAHFKLREDVLRLIKKAYQNEKNKKAKLALGWIIENAKIAQKESLAICQDTGFPLVFIEVGRNLNFSSLLVEEIEEAVETSYRENYLRPSIVKPLRRKKPSYKGIISHIEFSLKIKGLKITLFPKGFGSENKSCLKMFNPTASLEEIEEFVVESVKKAGPEACPPFIIGVGIGGFSDYALLLAKKALLERVDKPNNDKFLASLENKFLKRINSLKIGPFGLKGRNTALAVRIKTAPTHIAGLPVGVNISCWALRSASIEIQNSLPALKLRQAGKCKIQN